MPSAPYEVREGVPGKGRGVFTTRRIAIDEIVMEITGQLLRERDYSRGSLYCMDLRPGVILEPHAPGALVNHSCQPNCELIQHTDRSLALVAIVNIEPGQELSYNYGWIAEVALTAPRCRCGSIACRRYIVDDGREHQRLQRMLARRAQPRKRRR